MRFEIGNEGTTASQNMAVLALPPKYVGLERAHDKMLGEREALRHGLEHIMYEY